MKNRWIIMTLCALAACAVLTGCGSSSESESTEESSEESSETVDMPSLADLDLDEYLVLGEYKGITLEKEVEAVTDEDIETEIAYDLSSYPVDVSDEGAKVEEGDVVNIDYVGTMDGEEFDGGTAEDTDLTIGSGQFIDGFEDGLVGYTAGETVELDLTFPEDYSDDLGGKDVTFTVTINAVKRPLSEPTDEWVEENIDNCSTVEEYRESIQEELEEYYESLAEEDLSSTAWQQVVDSSEFLQYPEEALEYGEYLFTSTIETYAAYYSMELEEYIEEQGLTEEEYEEQAEAYGVDVAEQMLVMTAIIAEEGLSEEDEEYQTILEEYLTSYDMEEDEFIETYGEQTIYQSIMMQIIYDLIVDEAEIVEVEAEEETTEETVETDEETMETDEETTETD